ncbi:hypothetical protein TrST_g10519 [Triparma strigata]|uniref:Uncharacterized protein n=1 Tax=Triparma strigata TaxID=1606541 RepID=A0A9W7DU34_9STRA|nr:hypothetical protein TrST_g10519 [Triparma strigata]
MFIGEFLFTDSILAYISHHFKRYTNDVAKEWIYISKKKRTMTVACLCLSFQVVLLCTTIRSLNYCFTGWMGGVGGGHRDEHDCALTPCPVAPKNITEMRIVGVQWRAVFNKYN